LKLAACGPAKLNARRTYNKVHAGPPDQLSRNVAFSITASACCYACNHNWSQDQLTPVFITPDLQSTDNWSRDQGCLTCF